jgi:hypothetical protein
MAEKRVIVTKTGKAAAIRSANTGHFVVPRGKDLNTVTRDASRQVINNYGPALEKLKKH